jgi:hypothetical protein
LSEINVAADRLHLFPETAFPLVIAEVRQALGSIRAPDLVAVLIAREQLRVKSVAEFEDPNVLVARAVGEASIDERAPLHVPPVFEIAQADAPELGKRLTEFVPIVNCCNLNHLAAPRPKRVNMSKLTFPRRPSAATAAGLAANILTAASAAIFT